VETFNPRVPLSKRVPLRPDRHGLEEGLYLDPGTRRVGGRRGLGEGGEVGLVAVRGRRRPRRRKGVALTWAENLRETRPACGDCEELPAGVIVPGPGPEAGTVIESAAAVEAAELAAGPRTLRSGVPKPLSTRLAVGSSQSTALEAVELGECTAGSVDVVLFAFSR